MPLRTKSKSSVLNFKIPVHGAGRHAGLLRDARILERSLIQIGHEVTVAEHKTLTTPLWKLMISGKARALRVDRILQRGIAAAQSTRRLLGKNSDLTLHLEYVSPRYLMSSAQNLFVPNSEWFSDRLAWSLRFVDLALCKTRQAEAVFASAGCNAEYIGFTSEDCYVPAVSKDRSRWLHVASNGHQKGTDEILKAWRRNPTWPNLTIVAGKRRNSIPAGPNVTVIDDWIDDGQLRLLMQRCGVHLCPSNAEGFGHTIVESMSCGALVITTDLAPMNELVTADRGLLVDVVESTPMGWSRRASIETTELEAAVTQAIALSDDEYANLSAAARQWYLDNDRAFTERLSLLAERLGRV